MPGLQRALYDDEYAAIEYWFNKEQQGPQLLAAVCAAVYPLCMWLGVGGPCLVPTPPDAEGLSQLTGWASGLLSTLAVIQAKTAAAQQRRQQRKRQWEQEEEPAGAGARGPGQGSSSGNRPAGGLSSIAAAAAAGALPFGIRGLGYGALPPRPNASNQPSSSRDGTSAGASGAAGQQQQQQQQQESADPEVRLQEEMLLEVLTQAAELQIDPANPRKAQRLKDATKHLQPIVALLSGKLRARGEPSAAVRQHLLDLAAGSAVPQSKSIPRWLYGLRPLVAAELSSALLLLNDVRAEQCEISLIPGVNANVQHGYRGYWAVSVLAGADAWLGPGFKLSWQAVAVLNDMVAEVVQELCQVGVLGVQGIGIQRVYVLHAPCSFLVVPALLACRAQGLSFCRRAGAMRLADQSQHDVGWCSSCVWLPSAAALCICSTCRLPSKVPLCHGVMCLQQTAVLSIGCCRCWATLSMTRRRSVCQCLLLWPTRRHG
jgi:hypothetical protein